MNKLAVLAVLFAVIAAAAADPSECYVDDDNGKPVVTKVIADPDYVCVRYEYRCVTGDAGCTQAEIDSNARKTVYDYNTVDYCNGIKEATEKYTNVVCCNTSLCNKPSSANAASVFVPALLLSVAALLF